MTKPILAALMFFGLPAPSYSSEVSQNVPGFTKVLLMSDFHFDPEKPRGRTKDFGWPDRAAEDAKDSFKSQDSSYFLVRSALQAAQANCSNPAFIVCGGDFLGHNLPTNDLRGKTEAKLARLFADLFPGVKVVPTLGNNDTGGIDYSEPGTTFLGQFETAWCGEVPNASFNSKRSLSFTNLVQNNGSYLADLPGLSNVTAVVFNSTLVCNPPLWAQLSARTQDLNQILGPLLASAAKRGNVWIIFHIPPGWDYHNHNKMWRANERDTFVDMVATNADKITAMFAAHTHKNEFRVVYTNNVPVGFVSQIPGVAAGHHNNPSFQIATVECATGKIRDLQTYCLTNFSDLADTKANWGNFKANWVEEGSFSNTFPQAYNLGDGYYDQKSLNELLRELKPGDTNQNAELKNAFLRWCYTGHEEASNDEATHFSNYLNTLYVIKQGDE